VSVIYAGHAHEAGSFGVRARFDGIDMAGVNAYKNKVIGPLWKGLTTTKAQPPGPSSSGASPPATPAPQIRSGQRGCYRPSITRYPARAA
jgi:hypothetical protein